ncbi:hypothetical protein SS50377_27117 [Spironucleus salmonicida]|uniref:Uncharacterized protein n=1 Tax=Spironucleus salmonicida TaxID=348837 RepID=V6LGT4_9EUKA|nr:hypothetical protein SS50377_27117 [Spironucleus salmonicida]|eukprot:EST43755.1 Hypothetical protein SS50377_16491 [Spironucleus salmonicida]
MDYIAAYSALINNQHATFRPLFDKAADFEKILSQFAKITSFSDQNNFAAAILVNYEQLADQLHAISHFYASTYFKGLKAEKRQKRLEIFNAALRAVLAGAFYKNSALTQNSARQISTASPLESAQIVAILTAAAEQNLAQEYKFAEDLKDVDYYAAEFCVLAFAQDFDAAILERILAKTGKAGTIQELYYANLNHADAVLEKKINAEMTQKMQEIVVRYKEVGIEDKDSATIGYLLRSAQIAYALKIKGWEMLVDPESYEIVLSKGGLVFAKFK